MDLAGLRVLITRPRGRGETLAAAIRAAGGEVAEVPLLAVEPLDPQRDAELCRSVDARLQQLDRYDAIIVISINAVAMGLERASRFWPSWPTQPRWYAIGSATAEALQQWGVAASAPARGMYSEALLALPELQHMENQRVLIVRGIGGRETLASVLRARDATVEYAECYRRVEPVLDLAERTALTAPVDVICVNSAETLANLWNNLPESARADVYRRALIVPSARVAEKAHELGFQYVITAANAGTAATLDALAGIKKRA
ncbi:MAG: uroporphyrinogen-III synthase [Spongiibacteraceae bacterium]